MPLNYDLSKFEQERKEEYPLKEGNYRSSQIEIPKGATLVILIAPQGSGKSTLARKWKEKIDCNCIVVDEIFRKECEDFLEEGLEEEYAIDLAEEISTMECIKRAKESLKNEKITIIDGLFLDIQGRLSFLDTLKQSYRQVIGITIIKEKDWIKRKLFSRVEEQGITYQEIDEVVEREYNSLMFQYESDLLQIGLKRNYLLIGREDETVTIEEI